MSKANKRFVTITFKASREPVDDMFWCEAEYDGSWTNVILLDRLKTRREIIERILELESGLIGLDFPMSFPVPFMNFLAKEGLTGPWKNFAERIREELKKNTEDGIKLWTERMGRYRESDLESPEEAASRIRRPVQNRSGRRMPMPRAPYELRSKAERFRRIDHILKYKNPDIPESTLGIRYNKLTGRYDFLESEAMGRRTLAGIALLAQIIEQKADVSVWPFMRPAKVTIMEISPLVFPNAPQQNKLGEYFDGLEDNALFVAADVKETARGNRSAHNALFSLLGMLSAERRENKAIRPIRDYRDNFYENDEIQTEGWVYGVGFKELAPKPSESHPEISNGHNETAPQATEEAVTESAS
jgi:hypothetical protein